METIFFYISGHGFGHAVRQVAIVNALHPLVAGLADIVLRTSAPAWLFERTVRGDVTVLAGETDPGVVQLDALRLDERATVERAVRFQATFDSRTADEAALLRERSARLVIADAPPLACAAAAAAGVPSVVCANFTWDWIYEAYATPGDTAFREVLARMEAAYACAEAAWRLPLHGGFASMATIRDLPLVARRSRAELTAAGIRTALGLPLGEPLALASFGGFGVRDLPLARLDCAPSWAVVVTTPEEPAPGGPGVHIVPEARMREHGLGYEDLVRAVDVVVSKPGYGIVSDCAANGTALLYTSRGRFREYDVLVEGMPRFVQTAFLPMEDFREGRWRDGLDRAVAARKPADPPPVDGADAAARMIHEYVR